MGHARVLGKTPFGLESLVLRVSLVAEMEETRVQSLGQEDILNKGMATHSSILA